MVLEAVHIRALFGIESYEWLSNILVNVRPGGVQEAFMFAPSDSALLELRTSRQKSTACAAWSAMLRCTLSQTPTARTLMAAHPIFWRGASASIASKVCGRGDTRIGTRPACSLEALLLIGTFARSYLIPCCFVSSTASLSFP